MNKRRQKPDHYSRLAKREKYPARSIYKLQEINRRVRIIRRGDQILDLGAAPGSWSIYASGVVGPNGQVVAIDLKEIPALTGNNIIGLQLDVLEDDILKELKDKNCIFDAVLSDMAPLTTGHRFVDQSRSYDLFIRALEISGKVLRPGGRFAAKIFQGEDFEKAVGSVKKQFEKVRIMRPKSVKTESCEIYVIGLNFVKKKQ